MRYGDELSGISDVTVHKDELLGILKANRAKHHEVFEKALIQFRERAVTELDLLIERIRIGTLPKRLAVDLPIPEEHTDDYDRAIRMLEMHVGETITLSESAYVRLVDDDWGWRADFISNTISYLASE